MLATTASAVQPAWHAQEQCAVGPGREAQGGPPVLVGRTAGGVAVAVLLGLGELVKEQFER